MAEQEEPVRRRVALKIIKLGMDTRKVIHGLRPAEAFHAPAPRGLRITQALRFLCFLGVRIREVEVRGLQAVLRCATSWLMSFPQISSRLCNVEAT